MLQPERQYNLSSGYRYGFNGKESDPEIKGETNSYDFGARMYDPRLGRWLSVDPLQQKYTDLSPYQFCSNSPLSAKDPDGRLIIFINGLWGWPNQVGKGGTEDYWGADWVSRVQARIGDFKAPLYYDGSLGGTASWAISKENLNASARIKAGEVTGYNQAKAIISKLDKGETIKIVTNSMGTAFARGLTKGILKYQTEENERINTFNADIDSKVLVLSLQRNELISQQDKLPIPQTSEKNERLQKSINELNTKITTLNSQKKELINVRFEMVIDLSSHQIDYSDKNAEQNYYMTVDPKNMNFIERNFVDQRIIKGSAPIRKFKSKEFIPAMDRHHSSGAPPEMFPESEAKGKKN